MLLKLKTIGAYGWRILCALINFLRRALCENGEPSFSRVACAILIAAYIDVMLSRGNVPDNSEMFAAVLLALYGANAIKCGLGGYKSGADPAATPGTSGPAQGI